MSTDKQSDRGIMLVSYPKIIFMWPVWLVALAGAIFLSFVGAEGGTAVVVTWTFLFVLSLNLVVLGFDFPRATSLTLFFVAVALVLGGALLVVYFPNVLPRLEGWLTSLEPRANATFYWIVALVLSLIYAGVFVISRFDYWEVRPNELLHHHGVLSDLERFPSPHLRIEKEINDIFEYLLMGSGRLILQPSGERKAIILDNVLWISKKEKEITKLLGALQVQVRDREQV
ncbi:MAG: hypothetical protein KF861_17780 [Planctomycetaceae bacterium]|nr:hypothetical protein [Planctomycetaceae bacterium]